MKKRVIIAGLFHETHTFLAGTTGLADFRIQRRDEMFSAKGDSSPLGGVLELADEFGWEVIPALDYRAQPSAQVEDEVFESFWAELEPILAASDCEAIYLVLHGAMTTVSLQDVEGELLSRIRKRRMVRIFGVFDLHANFTPAMASLANGLVGYRENPHTDAREAACLAARLLERSLRTGVWPIMHFFPTDIVWPPTGTATCNDPLRSLNLMARKLEKEHSEIWSVSVVAGFSFADTEHTGVSLVLVLDNSLDSEPLSSRHLVSPMMTYLQSHRDLGTVTDPALSEVMPKLAGFEEGLTVLVEPSDNIGGGAPGDGTGLLRALIEYDITNCAICIADAAASENARAAGIGSTLKLSIGGKGSLLDAGPVELEVEVISLSEGRFELEDKQSHLASMCGDHFDMGHCAVVRHKGIIILLTTIKTPPFDLGQWRSQGIEPTQLSFIAVKAAVAHRRAYDPIASRMLWVATRGPCSSDLKTFPYVNIRRPIYPLDL